MRRLAEQSTQSASICANVAARLAYILSEKAYEAISSLFRDLHWVRVPQRIEFKLAVLTYRCLHISPMNSTECTADTDSRLRSASTSTIVVPPIRHSSVGGRAFPVPAASIWNSLPSRVTSSTTLSQNRAFLAMFRHGLCVSDDSALLVSLYHV